jgi:drug/metabolite transporter (DMT)-like permease
VAWIILDEALSGWQLVGVVLVIMGIVAAETARRQPTDVPPSAGIA